MKAHWYNTFFTNLNEEIKSTFSQEIISYSYGYPVNWWSFNQDISKLKKLLSKLELVHFNICETYLMLWSNAIYKDQLVSLGIILHNAFITLNPTETDTSILSRILFNITTILSQGVGIAQDQNEQGQCPTSWILVVSIEYSFEIIWTMLMRYFQQENYNFDWTNLAPEQIQQDLRFWFILDKSRKWWIQIVRLIDHWSSLSRELKLSKIMEEQFQKLYRSTCYKTNLVSIKLIISIISTVNKYYYNYDILKTEYAWINTIDLVGLHGVMDKLFNVFQENIWINYKRNENLYNQELNKLIVNTNEMTDIGHTDNITLFLHFGIWTFRTIKFNKFYNELFKYDFFTFYPFSLDYLNNCVKMFNEQMYSRIRKAMYTLKEKEMELEAVDIDLVTLKNFVTEWKDFIIWHIIASFNIDGWCDCFLKNEWWKQTMICYSWGKFLLQIYALFQVSKDKEFILNELFLELIETIHSNEWMFPIKWIWYKEILIMNHVIWFDYFVKYFKEELEKLISVKTGGWTFESMQYMDNLQDWTLNIKQLAKYQNITMFFLTNRIWTNWTKDIPLLQYANQIRLFINSSYPIDYYNIPEVTNRFKDEGKTSPWQNWKIDNPEIGTVEVYDISNYMSGWSTKFLIEFSTKQPGCAYITMNKGDEISHYLTFTSDTPIILSQNKHEIERFAFEKEEEYNFWKWMSWNNWNKSSVEWILQNYLYENPSPNAEFNVNQNMKFYKSEMDYFDMWDNVKKYFK